MSLYIFIDAQGSLQDFVKIVNTMVQLKHFFFKICDAHQQVELWFPCGNRHFDFLDARLRIPLQTQLYKRSLDLPNISIRGTELASFLGL